MLLLLSIVNETAYAESDHTCRADEEPTSYGNHSWMRQRCFTLIDIHLLSKDSNYKLTTVLTKAMNTTKYTQNSFTSRAAMKTKNLLNIPANQLVYLPISLMTKSSGMTTSVGLIESVVIVYVSLPSLFCSDTDDAEDSQIGCHVYQYVIRQGCNTHGTVALFGLPAWYIGTDW